MTHNVTFGHSIMPTGGTPSNTKSVTVQVVCDAEANYDVTVPPATTDKEVLATIDVSALLDIAIYTTADVSFQTNSPSSPVQTIALKANIPFVWVKDSGIANPLTTDITAIYLTNAGSAAATVNMRFGYDGTP